MVRKEITKHGNRIHALIATSLRAVETSEASPGWQDYINFTNEIIYNGFRKSSWQSLSHMHAAMALALAATRTSPATNASSDTDTPATGAAASKLRPFVCINLELIDNKLLFDPPLDRNNNFSNLQEILFEFINSFISRGSYMFVLGNARATTTYDQLVARDEATFDMVNKINTLIERTCDACQKVADKFAAFDFLWKKDINVAFDEFLRGQASLASMRRQRPPSKNFMSVHVAK